MNSKKLISFFLTLVLSIQVLPMQQIAAWLSSGQVTEEIAHTINPVKAKQATDEGHPPFEFHTYPSHFQKLAATGCFGQHQDEDLFIRHADEILSPPPNC